MCLNIEIDVILTNIKFFTVFNKSDIEIRIMTIFMTVKNLNANKHFINKYVVVFIYLKNKNDKNNFVQIEITNEIHLINNFKINLFIDNDILKFEHIDVMIFINTTRINNCKINVFICFIFTIKTRISNFFVYVV